nr:MAG TPA_asm: hypothetical protein [Caudoviricetes sp.]
MQKQLLLWGFLMIFEFTQHFIPVSHFMCKKYRKYTLF